MLGQASNPLLAKAEEALQAKVAPQLQKALERVVHAGLTIMYSPNLKGELQKRLAASKNPPQEAGEGAARMMSNLYKQSNKTLPMPTVVPAAMIFAFEYLDLLEKAGKVEVTPQLVAQTAHAVGDMILPMMGVSADKLKEMVQKSQGGAAPAPAGIIGAAQGGA